MENKFEVTFEDKTFKIDGKDVESRIYYLHVGDYKLKFKLVEGELAKRILDQVIEIVKK